MQMTHREAIDLSVVLTEVMAHWNVVEDTGHGDLARPSAERLLESLGAHWEENGCSFDAGRDGMTFPEACQDAQPARPHEQVV